jgi:hypothetical protein
MYNNVQYAKVVNLMGSFTKAINMQAAAESLRLWQVIYTPLDIS